MLGAIFTVIATIAFAIGPFLVPNFQGFAPELFPVPQFRPPVQPAGYAFAIWGLIYLWLLVSAGFGLWQRREDAAWVRMRPALIMSLAIGAAWLPIAQNSPLMAAVMIWMMWLTAVAALFRAPSADRLMAAWPIGLYAGWLSAAACVATGLNLAGYGILEPEVAALAMMALAITLSACLQLALRGAPSFGVAVVWALYAIYVANKDSNGDVAGLAIGGVIGVGALTGMAFMREVRGQTA